MQVARDIDSHVHRIGRTGRAGDKGQAYTLINTSAKKEMHFAGDLVRNLEVSEQYVPPELVAFAREDPKFVQRQVRHPELKVRAPAHTKHIGWHLEFELRVTQARHAADRTGLGFGGGAGGGGGGGGGVSARGKRGNPHQASSLGGLGVSSSPPSSLHLLPSPPPIAHSCTGTPNSTVDGTRGR